MDNLGTSIITNILDGNHLEAWAGPITYFAWLIGLLFVIIGLVMFTQANNKGAMQRPTHGAAIASMCAGFALLSLQAIIAAGTYTIFASDSAGDYEFANGVLVIQDLAKGNTSGPEALYMELVVYLMEIIGFIAVIKACFLFREASQTSKAAVAGIWHFMGGIIALNFKGAINLVGETGGPDVQSILSRLFG